MSQKEMAKQTLEKKLKDYKEYQTAQNKAELDRHTEYLISQTKMCEEVSLITSMFAKEYLDSLEKAYDEKLREFRKTEVFDIEKSKQTLFPKATKPKEVGLTLEEWEKELSTNEDDASGNKERDEVVRDKADEREEEKAWDSQIK